MQRISGPLWVAFLITGCSLFTGGTQTPAQIGSEDARIQQESVAISQVSSDLQAALKAGNTASALEQFAPEVKSIFGQSFANAGADKLTRLAEALSQAKVDAVTDAAVKGTDLSAELSVSLDGRTFHVELVKRDGKWLFQSL